MSKTLYHGIIPTEKIQDFMDTFQFKTHRRGAVIQAEGKRCDDPKFWEIWVKERETHTEFTFTNVKTLETQTHKPFEEIDLRYWAMKFNLTPVNDWTREPDAPGVKQIPPHAFEVDPDEPTPEPIQEKKCRHCGVYFIIVPETCPNCGSKTKENENDPDP